MKYFSVIKKNKIMAFAKKMDGTRDHHAELYKPSSKTYHMFSLMVVMIMVIMMVMTMRHGCVRGSV
jgi:hypothetical protein